MTEAGWVSLGKFIIGACVTAFIFIRGIRTICTYKINALCMSRFCQIEDAMSYLKEEVVSLKNDSSDFKVQMTRLDGLVEALEKNVNRLERI